MDEGELLEGAEDDSDFDSYSVYDGISKLLKPQLRYAFDEDRDI